MGKITVPISFEEVRENKEWVTELYSLKWLAEHGLDSQRPIYITPDYVKEIYYIDGWGIEDADLETD